VSENKKAETDAKKKKDLKLKKAVQEAAIARDS
jgi:hypothetical protein